MSTKLDAMIGLLAGRKVEPALLDELADPASEASRFLEATRARSRALLADSSEGDWQPKPPARPGRGRTIALVALVMGSLALFAATLWLADRRFRRLEAGLSERAREVKEDARRIEAILERLAAPEPRKAVEAALERIEVGLIGLDHGQGKPQPPARPDPALDQIRDELARMRLELMAADRVGARRVEELQATVHDAARVVRLLLNQAQPPERETPSPPHPPANVEPRRVKP